ncbi:MAG: aldo/keto reductase family oxidoreductase [Breznakia sp.]
MKYITIAKDLKFSRIIQGFWRLNEWNLSTTALKEMMEACIERGVTTFDTAEIYGHGDCEIQLGNVLKTYPNLRQQIQLVSKTGISLAKVNGNVMGYYDTTYDHIIQACKDSLERLHCEYLDLYLIHREDPCIDHHAVAKALKDLQTMGLIRYYGVSNFGPFKFNALQTCTNNNLKTNQIEWNPICFEHFDNGMMDVLMEQQIPPMIWSPVAGGEIFKNDNPLCVNAMVVLKELAKKYDCDVDTIIYAWILYHPVQAMPIVGSSKIERLDKAIAALDISLDHFDWYRIYTASKQQILR